MKGDVSLQTRVVVTWTLKKKVAWFSIQDQNRISRSALHTQPQFKCAHLEAKGGVVYQKCLKAFVAMRIHYGNNIASNGHMKRNVAVVHQHLLYVVLGLQYIPITNYQPILDIDIIRIPVERGQYGRRPSPVYQHYPSHHRNIHGSHLDQKTGVARSWGMLQRPIMFAVKSVASFSWAQRKKRGRRRRLELSSSLNHERSAFGFVFVLLCLG